MVSALVTLGWSAPALADERCDRVFEGVDAIVLVGEFEYEDGCVGTGYTVDGVAVPDRADAGPALERLGWSSPASRAAAALLWATTALHDGAVAHDRSALLDAEPTGPSARRWTPTPSVVPSVREKRDGSVVVSFWTVRALVNQRTRPWSGYTLYQALDVRFAPDGRAEVEVWAERIGR